MIIFWDRVAKQKNAFVAFSNVNLFIAMEAFAKPEPSWRVAGGSLRRMCKLMVPERALRTIGKPNRIFSGMESRANETWGVRGISLPRFVITEPHLIDSRCFIGQRMHAFVQRVQTSGISIITASCQD